MTAQRHWNRNAFNDGYIDAMSGFENTNQYNDCSMNWRRYNLGYLKGTIDLHSGEENESKRDNSNSCATN